MEIWKQVDGYEGMYEVSNYGEVKSVGRYTTGNRHRKLKEKMLKKHENSFGYWLVALCKNGKAKDFRVHRLVAEAFIPKVFGKPFINHKDGNPKNNNVDNLEWCTQKENIQHAYKTGLVKRHGKLKDFDEYILKTYKKYSKNSNFRTMAKVLGVDWTSICRRYHQLMKNPKYANKYASW